MLKSMTAFARIEHESDFGSLTWELRTVNHRYLEPNIKLPDAFREIEPKLRALMRSYLSRGKLDGMLKWQPSAKKQDSLTLNQDVLKSLHSATQEISNVFEGIAPLNALSILQWPGVIDTESADRQKLCAEALEAFEASLKILVENREREGA
ncbi:MAG: hypothetical protein ACJAWS_003271, partial [Oleiphilaceae bacterium]